MEGTSAVDIEAWARFRPEVETSESVEARNPEGVRTTAPSRAMDCSRRALALSLFSSYR